MQYVCDWDRYVEMKVGLERFQKHWVRVSQKGKFFLWKRMVSEPTLGK